MMARGDTSRDLVFTRKIYGGLRPLSEVVLIAEAEARAQFEEDTRCTDRVDLPVPYIGVGTDANGSPYVQVRYKLRVGWSVERDAT